MRLLLVLLVFVALGAWAAPFVEADVVAGVTQCGVVLDSQPKVLVTAASNKCRFDLTTSLPSGAHTVTMTAISTGDPVFGTQESVPSSPFPFTKPAMPASPATLRLTP